MISESAISRNRIAPAPRPLNVLALLAAFAGLAALPARAEDPLLGRIKVIQCVGCTPGSVDLVIHDPIDVRDFQVRINEGDYQKIITPLAGKTVYDKEGCFYWMDAPKGGAKAAEPAPAAAPTAPAKETKDAKTAKGGKKAGHNGAAADTTPGAAPADALVEAAAPAPTPELQGTPSKCIPFARVEVKPTRTGKKEEE